MEVAATCTVIDAPATSTFVPGAVTEIRIGKTPVVAATTGMRTVVAACVIVTLKCSPPGKLTRSLVRSTCTTRGVFAVEAMVSGTVPCCEVSVNDEVDTRTARVSASKWARTDVTRATAVAVLSANDCAAKIWWSIWA
jgi:hypothetical protein